MSILRVSLQDQLVPNEVLDTSKQSSAARMVLSGLSPQPYSVTFSPISHSLSPGCNIFEPVVPENDRLEHVTQVSKDVDSPEPDYQQDGQNEIDNDFAKNTNYNLEDSSMEMIFSHDSDVCLVSSIDTCHDGSKTHPSKYKFIFMISLKLCLLKHSGSS